MCVNITASSSYYERSHRITIILRTFATNSNNRSPWFSSRSLTLPMPPSSNSPVHETGGRPWRPIASSDKKTFRTKNPPSRILASNSFLADLRVCELRVKMASALWGIAGEHPGMISRGKCYSRVICIIGAGMVGQPMDLVVVEVYWVAAEKILEWSEQVPHFYLDVERRRISVALIDKSA